MDILTILFLNVDEELCVSHILLSLVACMRLIDRYTNVLSKMYSHKAD